MTGVAFHLELLMNFTQLSVRDILYDLFDLASEDLLELVIVIVTCIVVFV